jgi:hypothetical protein
MREVEIKTWEENLNHEFEIVELKYTLVYIANLWSSDREVQRWIHKIEYILKSKNVKIVKFKSPEREVEVIQLFNRTSYYIY